MKLGILITTYNRPEYLASCLASVRDADIPEGTDICIVDDHSTNPQTISLIQSFKATKIFKQQNKSIKDSMLIGCEILFADGCDVITNLDGDAVVAKDFVIEMLKLREQFPNNILTGFNCVTKNLNGTERHKIVEEGKGWNKKRSVGGINMMFDRAQYDRWIKPALLESLAQGGNWDHKSCIRSGRDGFEIVCRRPSIVQHIGINSSMGHSNVEPPDVADDFTGWTPSVVKDVRIIEKLQLPHVALLIVDCVDVRRAQKAINLSRINIEFGQVMIFTSLKPPDDTQGVQFIHVDHLSSKSEYSVFMMKILAYYIPEGITHILTVQYDGFVLNSAAWRDEWLAYDYIGAPWEWYNDHRQVGNGGFALRSKRLHDILRTDPAIIPKNEPGITQNKEEDHCICRLYRDYLESKYQIKFAPLDEARKFSIEGWNTKNRVWNGEFGFHSRGVDISKSGIKL